MPAVIEAPITLIAAPITMVGSMGPIWYTVQEVKRSTPLWDGVPITLDHPTHNGVPVFAAYAPESHIGVVRKPKFAHNRLQALGRFWVDRLPPTLLEALRKGERVEVSTGLGVACDQAPPDCVGRDYKPDHLAVLLHSRGACSLEDGCGVNNVTGAINMAYRTLAAKLAAKNRGSRRKPELTKEARQLLAEMAKNAGKKAKDGTVDDPEDKADKGFDEEEEEEVDNAECDCIAEASDEELMAELQGRRTRNELAYDTSPLIPPGLLDEE